MKKLMFFLICLIIAGCEYAVPLPNAPNIDIDRSVLGLWQTTKNDGRTEDLLVLPLGEQKYMISFPSGTKNSMFALACLWRDKGMTLVQLNWFGTAQAEIPKDDRTYQFASYLVEGDEMRIRMLNKEVVNENIGSSKELAKAILDNRTNTRLFRDEMLFKKINK